MDIHKSGSRPDKIAGADAFTGHVVHEPIVQTPAPATLRALKVTFAPGARTHWHHHALGQTLYVTAGQGLVQTKGAAPRMIRTGDTVWIPPGEVHWHGADATHQMSHIAMQEDAKGDGTTWLEPVSDADYAAKPEV